jgi:hypothetical protein
VRSSCRSARSISTGVQKVERLTHRRRHRSHRRADLEPAAPSVLGRRHGDARPRHRLPAGGAVVRPLILVQPLGAVSLVITTLLNARISGHKPTRRSLTAIGLCVAGIFIFVTIAAVYATETPISDGQIVTILLILAGVAIVLTALWLWLRTRSAPCSTSSPPASCTASWRRSRRSCSAASAPAISSGSRSSASSRC